MRQRILGIIIVCLSFLLVVGCTTEVNQSQPSEDNKDLIKSVIVDSASITNRIRKTSYPLSSEEAESLMDTLEKPDLSDHAKILDEAFTNTLVFYDKAEVPIMSVRVGPPDRGLESYYQLIIDDTLTDGKPYTSKVFYDKLNEIVKIHNYELPGLAGD